MGSDRRRSTSGTSGPDGHVKEAPAAGLMRVVEIQALLEARQGLRRFRASISSRCPLTDRSSGRVT